MKLEVQWLAYLATQAGLLDSAKCLVLKQALGIDADILAFGEKLYDRGYCSDFDLLQELAAQAFTKAESNQPVPANPFKILTSSSDFSANQKKPLGNILKPDNPASSVKPLSLRPSPMEVPDTRAKDPIPKTGPVSINSTPPATKPSIPPIQRWKPSQNRKPISVSTTAEPHPIHPTDSPSGQSTALKSSAAETTRKASTSEVVSPEKLNEAPGEPSKDCPSVSLDVADQWPDLDSIHSLSEEAARPCMAQLLLKCQKEGVSDLHLSAGSRPFIRRNRMIEYLGQQILSRAISKTLNTSLLSEFQKNAFECSHDVDHALALDPARRYRVNLMRHKEGISATYRVIPDTIPSLEALGFHQPGTIRNLLSYHNGLIMVTGPLGSGKTTTLAALIDELNNSRQDHLIAVESPIEIVQNSKLCQITQREVGAHTRSFQSALKGALRQDPDIIVIGEMRDLETVEMAISASETGHLVIGTMHTSDSANTLNRLLDVFPAAQQSQIRSMVAESLRGIVCQRLLPSTEGGVALAYELLLNNAAVGNLIRANKAEGLSNIIETGRSEGMILMDKSLFSLWESRRISDEVALANLTSLPMKEEIHRSKEPQMEAEEPPGKRFSLTP